jgi:hypothetical protein
MDDAILAGMRRRMRALNHAYLQLARDCVLQHGGELAEALLGLSPELCEWLSKADGAAVDRLARSPALVFGLRLPPEVPSLLRACEDAAREDLLGVHVLLTALGDAHEGPLT